MAERPPRLTVRDLSVDYEVRPPVAAVRNVNLTVAAGEILGLAGESGCGKTTLAYAINRLAPAARADHQRLGDLPRRRRHDLDLLTLDDERLRVFRWYKLSMVFQGAMNALNPVISIRAQLDDVLTTHRPQIRRGRAARIAADALRRVGVDPARLSAYPHELSGGMRQRVMIAMALVLEPQMMIMDEPTTALDVVVQRDILREIVRLRDELDFAVIFITHDLPLLLEISDRIAIMLQWRDRRNWPQPERSTPPPSTPTPVSCLAHSPASPEHAAPSSVSGTRSEEGTAP